MYGVEGERLLDLCVGRDEHMQARDEDGEQRPDPWKTACRSEPRWTLID